MLEDFARLIIYDKHFANCFPDIFHDFRDCFKVALRSGYLNPWRHVSIQDSGLSNVVSDKDSFKVKLDVQQFKPEELTVTVAYKYLVVKE